MVVRRRTRRQRIENCCDLTNERTNESLVITYEIIKLDSIASNKHINETYCVMCVNLLHPQCNRNARQVTNKVTYFDCKRLQDNVCSKPFSFLHSMAILWRFFLWQVLSSTKQKSHFIFVSVVGGTMHIHFWHFVKFTSPVWLMPLASRLYTNNVTL